MRKQARRGGLMTSRRFARVVATASVLAVVFVISVPIEVSRAQGANDMALQTTPTCNDGNVCVWSSAAVSYSGYKDTFNCSTGSKYVSFNEAYSIKNRCGNKRSSIGWRHSDGTINFKACLNPGGELPLVERFNLVYVADLGSRC